MGGTTSFYKFPYPSGTDRLMDGDNAMQSLAETVESVLKGSGTGNQGPRVWTAQRAGTTPVSPDTWVGFIVLPLTGMPVGAVFVVGAQASMNSPLNGSFLQVRVVASAGGATFAPAGMYGVGQTAAAGGYHVMPSVVIVGTATAAAPSIQLEVFGNGGSNFNVLAPTWIWAVRIL